VPSANHYISKGQVLDKKNSTFVKPAQVFFRKFINLKPFSYNFRPEQAMPWSIGTSVKLRKGLMFQLFYKQSELQISIGKDFIFMLYLLDTAKQYFGAANVEMR